MIKVAIIYSEFNSQITEQMKECAIQRCKEKSVEIVKIVKVPGAYDIALIADKMCQNKSVQAVITLGAIIKGDTKHDEAIGFALSTNLQRISVERKKPIMLCVIGPGATYQQAEKRAKEYARRAVDSAIEMINTIEAISD